MAAAGRSEGQAGAAACRTFLVAGHNIQFPHAAYGTQLSFMNQARPRRSLPHEKRRSSCASSHRMGRLLLILCGCKELRPCELYLEPNISSCFVRRQRRFAYVMNGS